MIRHLKEVRRVARAISNAADQAFEAYRDDRVVEEPQITDRILGAIELGVQRLSSDSYEDDLDYDTRLSRNLLEHEIGAIGVAPSSSPITWKARTLRTGRGSASEEKRHGADLLGVLDLNLEDYRATKGFLAQAKRVEPDQPLSRSEWKRLQLQCEAMLSRTPEAFVWAYSKSWGIRVFSANAILGLRSRVVFDLYSRSLSRFFESHLESFVGDRRLNSTRIKTLDSLRELPVERALEVSASQAARLTEPTGTQKILPNR